MVPVAVGRMRRACISLKKCFLFTPTAHQWVEEENDSLSLSSLRWAVGARWNS